MDAFTTPQFEAALFRDAPIGLAFVAADGRFVRVNDALCQITGYSQGELQRRTFQEITHPEDVDADNEMVGKLLAGNGAEYSMLKRYLTKDSRVVWVHLEVRIVKDDKGAFHTFAAWVLPLPNGGRFHTSKNEQTGAVEVRAKVSVKEFVVDNWPTIKWLIVAFFTVVIPTLGGALWKFMQFYHALETSIEKLPK